MNIAVVGTSGKSGRVFAMAAVAAGHQVRGGIYHKNSGLEAQGLTLVKCDATNQQDIENLITGQDAVVCLIGHVRGSPANVQTDAIKNIIAVMEKSGPKRLISLTGTGVRLPSDKFRLIDHLMNAAIKLADISRITDGINHVHIIQKSNLSWTVIRVLKLTNSRPRKYKLLPHGPTKILIPRAEVAQAILECLEQNSFVKKAPIIG